MKTNDRIINALNSKEEGIGKCKGGFVDEETLKFDLIGDIICPGREEGKWYSRSRKWIEQEYGLFKEQWVDHQGIADSSLLWKTAKHKVSNLGNWWNWGLEASLSTV